MKLGMRPDLKNCQNLIDSDFLVITFQKINVLNWINTMD